MISPGDLVMVVRGHKCVLLEMGGIPMTVGLVRQSKIIWCSECNRYIHEPTTVATFSTNNVIPVSWLKRIPPLGELESVERKEMEPA